jgi:hypothetical protein
VQLFLYFLLTNIYCMLLRNKVRLPNLTVSFCQLLSVLNICCKNVTSFADWTDLLHNFTEQGQRLYNTV